jgi:hypothetical protein
MRCCWQKLTAASLHQSLSHDDIRAVEQSPDLLELLQFTAFMPIRESTALQANPI